MAQSIVIRGNTFPDVPAIKSPQSNGQGDAYFYDVSDATLSDGSKLAAGETAYTAGGVKVTGTAPENDSTDLTVSGATVTAPAGIYATAASKSVASGSSTAPATITGSSASVSTGSNTITLSKTVSVTPTVSPGYVASGTAGNSTVSLTASVTTKAAATITPGTTNQEIAAGTYLTGKQTIAGDANLKSSNIVAGVSIFNTQGSAQIPVISQDSTTKIVSIS